MIEDILNYASSTRRKEAGAGAAAAASSGPAAAVQASELAALKEKLAAQDSLLARVLGRLNPLKAAFGQTEPASAGESRSLLGKESDHLDSYGATASRSSVALDPNASVEIGDAVARNAVSGAVQS